MSEILVIPGGEAIERYLEATKKLPGDVSLFQANLINHQYEVTEIELFLTNNPWPLLGALDRWLFRHRYGFVGELSSLKRFSVMVDINSFKSSFHQTGELADLLSKIPIQRYPVCTNIVYLDVVFVSLDKESHKLQVEGEKIKLPFTYMSEQSVRDALVAFFVRQWNIPTQIEQTLAVEGSNFVIPIRF